MYILYLKISVFFNFRAKQLNYNYTLLRDILSSRKKLLESRTNQPVKTPLAVLRMKRKSVKTRSDFDDRVAKRYFKELNVMRQGEGGENRDSSEDENYPSKIIVLFALKICVVTLSRVSEGSGVVKTPFSYIFW